MYAKVLIQYSVKKLDREFVYIIPIHLRNKVKVGMQVIVPFNKQRLAGFVIDIMPTYESNFVLKEISEIHSNLVLNDELITLGKYLKEITLCPLISAYQAMFPSALKIKNKKNEYALYDEYIYLKNETDALRYVEENKKRKAQIKIIERLLNGEEILKSSISYQIVKSLKENNIIDIKKVQKYRINNSGCNVLKELTNEQLQVYNQVDLNTYNTYLLYGVTGSGKTEIYIKLINDVLKQNKTAILLVPEISLTTQISKRFYEAFGNNVAILNSSLSDGEKYDEYQKIYRKEVSVVVGTRSAIFAPFDNLGIIIMDEEDSSSYKQDSNPRYHAKDVAIFRAKYHNIPLLLGSATPSLESMSRALKKVYKLLMLKTRVNKTMPVISLVDMASEIKKGNNIFSDELKNKINEKLRKNEQIILFLNRRGYSTFINCSNCGYVFKCPNCDITLTYHKNNNMLVCHYCNYQKKVTKMCPKCLNDSLNYYGLGTEKLEDLITKTFKDASVIRMDQDTTKNKGKHEQIINDFYNGKYNILVGTQMISKGLDFPNVTLVGVINADVTLNIPEYKSVENTFALLSQISGRSGRGEKLGEVVIQTFNPDHYCLKCVQNNDYVRFYNNEMDFRHKLKYPPYYYLISLKVIGNDYHQVIYESKEIYNYLKNNLSNNTYLLGPSALNVFRFKNEYRMQIIIKYQKEINLMTILKELDNKYIESKSIRLEIDFNPVKM